MSPSELREYVEMLRDLGVRRGSLVVADTRLDFELTPTAPAGELVTRDGKPIDLDEGNPWVDQGDKVYEANFQKAG